MLNVGLTGGIASGKSTVARMLKEKGAILIDFDELAHVVQKPDGPVWMEIVRHFGQDILQADRTIDRRKLGAVVFADRTKLDLLNRLVHPAVLSEWQRRMEKIRKTRPDAVVLSDIPLLIEAGLMPMVDVVLLVYLSPEGQIRRLMARNGYSREDAGIRLASQMPIGEKIPHADFVIRNEGPLEETRRAVGALWKELRQRHSGVDRKPAD
ncbi:MAG: dephospho-CoA kinase [Proteobacteria bacterium]|nr:dephospho-CoA kinase [Pseudomonadota bacterium]